MLILTGAYKDTWRALEKLYKNGRVKAIRVSNFQVHHLEDLLQDAEIRPMVNQVEFHPYLTLFDFELTGPEMDQIDALNQDRRVGPDPDNFDF